MGKIRVRRKAYTRRAYTRKDGTRVKAARVPATTYTVKDRGAKGRTPKSKRWFHPKRVTGWRKSDKPDTRRRKLLAATDKRLSLHDRYVQAGRMIQQLANVTTDKATEAKAHADAKYFFRKAKGR